MMDDPGYLIALAFSNCHRRHYIARAQGLCAYLCSSHRSYIHGFSSKCRVLCINTQIFLFFSSRYFFFSVVATASAHIRLTGLLSGMQ